VELTESTGYLLLDHLTKILGGWQDQSIGYSHHDAALTG
jgi:hypothetical protein